MFELGLGSFQVGVVGRAGGFLWGSRAPVSNLLVVLSSVT